jgi:hypothetical protein
MRSSIVFKEFKKMEEQIYFTLSVAQIPRILGLCDRNIMSPTYGCFDRDYWHYKRVDVPFSTMQKNILILALVYTNKDTIYYNKKMVLDTIKAGIDFWVKLQHEDGSFSDFYPNERSQVTAAFTLYNVCKTLLILPELLNKKITKAIERSVDFLVKHVDMHAINHELGAIAALSLAEKIIKRPGLHKEIEKKINFVLKVQSKEGWFPEYGGLDVGYLSVCLSYLGKIIEDYGTNPKITQKLKESMNKAINMLSYFVYSEGTVGGEYSSRNTQYVVPYGIEVASKWNATAVSIKKVLMETLNKSKAIGPYSFDDRYMCLYLYDYLLSYYYSKNNKRNSTNSQTKYNKKLTQKELLPYEQNDFEKFFKEAELFVKKSGKSYLIIGLKTATFRYFYEGILLHSDAGYAVRYENKKSLAASGCFSISEYNISKEEILIKKRFNAIKYRTSTTIGHFGLRILTFKGILSNFLRENILKVLLKEGKKTDIFLTRKIKLSNGTAEIEDIIESKKRINLYSLNEFNYRYIPSAQYFNINLINANNRKIGEGYSFFIKRFFYEGKEKITTINNLKKADQIKAN